MARSPVSEHHPQQGRLVPEEDDERDDRDPEVSVVDVLTVRGDGFGKDGRQADVAGADKGDEGGESEQCREFGGATCHEVEVYRRVVSRPAVATFADPIESRSDCGWSQKASLRRS